MKVLEVMQENIELVSRDDLEFVFCSFKNKTVEEFDSFIIKLDQICKDFIAEHENLFIDCPFHTMDDKCNHPKFGAAVSECDGIDHNCVVYNYHKDSVGGM